MDMQLAQDSLSKKGETTSPQQQINLQDVYVPGQSIETQMVFDQKNGLLFRAIEGQDSSEVNPNGENQSDAQGSKITLFDKDGQKIQQIEVNPLLQNGDHVENQFNDHMSDESEQKRALYGQRFSDNFSILRFIKGNKSKGLEISPSGLTLKLNKSKGSKQTEEELVLTNMAFYSGLHLWEIIAPITVGVYNPVTKQEQLASFKTTTPRVITICLDLNENQVKFWLNDRRNTNKNIKLPGGGPWIPCAKISVEKNKIILNPFAKEPSDFYEKDFDKKFTLKKFLMPQLHNMVCVTKLPQMSSQQKASKLLKEQLKISSSSINKILMSHSQVENGQQTSSENESFCFVQFHYYDQMVDFLDKNKEGSLKIYQPYQIAEWFEQQELSEEFKEPFKIISEHIIVPKASQEEVLNALSKGFDKLINNQSYKSQQEQYTHNSQINITQQPFTDKLICVKDQQLFRIISRDQSTQDFDIYQANFNEAPSTIDHPVTMKFEQKYLEILFQYINWSSLLKEPNEILNSLIIDFIDQFTTNAKEHGQHIITKVSLTSSKFFLDNCIQHMRSQLDRLKRQYQNNQTIIEAETLITRNKVEQPLPEVSSLPFFRDHNLSVDELYLIIHILYDLQEQVWAQTRSSKSSPEVKQFMNSVSRPYSAFNRLGSYVSWGLSNVSPKTLANQGFYFKENQTISQYENPSIEIQDLSEQNLLDENLLQELLGTSNRFMKSLVTENIPLNKTLNYLAPQKLGNFQDIIASQNNDFVIIGLNNGSAFICNSGLQLTTLKTISMFSNDMPKKVKKHNEVLQKIFSRISAFEEYKRQNLKKSVPISILKNFKKPKANEKEIQAALNKQQQRISKHKKQKSTKVEKKEKKKKNQASKTEDNPLQLGSIYELFGEEQDKNLEDDSTNISKQISFECKILGYFLLSKPAFEKFSIDPITVGCLFFSSKTQKFYIRARKLMITPQYLHNFIALDPVSGLQINKLNGKQLLNTDDFYTLYEEILNHKENIIDLYSLFMRTQVIKKDWPKKDYKFSVLTELSEAELEIQDCKKVIDFTRCSYSITNQNKVHVIIQDTNDKNQLLQFYIKGQDFNQDTQIATVKIEKGKEMELEKEPLRVFQFDEKILIVGKDYYLILDQNNFKIEFDEKLNNEVIDTKQVTILNQTPQNKLFCQDNVHKFASGSIPPQEWVLALSYGIEQSAQIYSLNQGLFGGQGRRQKTEKIQDIDLKQCSPNDLVQIGNLLESKFEGIIAKNNESSILTSSGIDKHNSLFIHHNWQIIDNKQKTLEFEFKLPENNDIQCHLKQIDLEFSLKRKVVQPVQLDVIPLDDQVQNSFENDQNSNIKRLPLVVESFSGAQINDIIQPNYLITPDSVAFSSNYPQPEFIFKLQNGKAFIPKEFVIRSKENREFNGIPISQGLIFVSQSYEDLMHTKQFSKFTQKEYSKWKAQRDKLRNIPLLPNEPVGFFDLEDKTEIIINIDIHNPVRYIKFIPTAFRKRPINFSSKPFHSNQAEIQFFGVNGFEQEHNFRGVTNDSYNSINQALKNQLDVNVKINLKDKDIGIIDDISSIKIKGIRNPKAQFSSTPIISIGQLKIPNITGIATVQIPIKEDHSDCISNFILEIGESLNEEWEIQGVSVAVESYTDSSSVFSSQTLADNKPRLRHYLLDVSLFSKLLKQLIDIIQDQQEQDDKKVAALQCILNYLRNNSQDKNYSEQIRNFRTNTNINLLLNDNFLDHSLKYQQLSQLYLDKIGLMRQQGDFKIEEFIQKQINQLFDRARPIQKVKAVFDMLQLCDQQRKSEIQSSLVDLLVKRLCQEELPKYQTPEYIALRSKFNINSYPFDNVQFKKQEGDGNDNKDQDGHDGQSHLLNCDFEMYKMNTLYQYNFDLSNNSIVEKIKLFFENDVKSLYKICVRIIVPDNQGCETIYYSRSYDENTYSQLCEKTDKPEVLQYFGFSPNKKQEKSNQENIDKDQLEINCLNIELFGFVGRFFKLQIDLMDTYKTVHKSTAATMNFIRPEIYGRKIDEKEFTAEQVKKLSKFTIRTPNKTNLVGNQTFNGINYEIYGMPDSVMSVQQKACLISLQKVSEQQTQKKESSNKDLTVEKIQSTVEQDSKKLIEERDYVRQLVTDSRLKTSKNKLRNKITEINKISSRLNASSEDSSDNKLSLKYLLNLGDVLSQNVLQALKNEPELIKDPKEAYLTLFKHFTVYDIKDLHLNVQKLLEQLFTKIEGKSKFICLLFKDFLMIKDSQIYSQKNVLDFIKEQQDVDFNQLIQDFYELFELQDSQESEKVDSEKMVNYLFKKIQEKVNQGGLSIHSFISFLNIIDDLKINKAKEYIESLQLDQLLQLITTIISKCSQIRDYSDASGTIALQYAFKIVNKFIQMQHVKGDNIIDKCQSGIATMIILALQRNDKAIDKNLKEFMQDLGKFDTQGAQTQIIGSILQWYKNKNNINSTEYYQNLEQQQSGLGSGIFYKHLAQVFKLYVKALQSQKRGDDQTIENAYRDLGSLMNNLLNVLTIDQDQQNYEQNFCIVWAQIYKSISYLIQHNLQNKEMVDLLAVQFYNLKPIFQEVIYPKFHHITEKLMTALTVKDPQMMITLLKSFLFVGFQNQGSIKIAYCFCDGLLNIIQTLVKDKQNQSSISCIFKPKQIGELTDILQEFLIKYCNMGVFTGVTGALIENIMKLDLSLQMSSILLNSNTKDGVNAFEEFIKSDDIRKKDLIGKLLSWIFVNYSNQKGKSSPAGSRIYNLSQQLEQIICKVSASPESVSECLPILMKSILATDYKLRDLIQSSQINHERAISIQKTVNTLFLSFFKAWVQTDNVAKQFLIELNGFDFLLDRLFSKNENKDDQVFLQSLLDQDNKEEDKEEDEEDEDDEDDQIMGLVKQKLQDKQGQKLPKPQTKLDKLKSMKAKSQSLPIMKKATALLDDVPSIPIPSATTQNIESQMKDVEQKLMINDWATNFKIIQSSDKQKVVQNSSVSAQWHKFKNGTKNRIFNYQINDQTHNYEYFMKFELENLIQINEIQIGLLYNWSQYDPDCQYEPLTFILEGGKTEECNDWKVLLKPVQDDGFKMNAITVYGYNFTENNLPSNYQQENEGRIEKSLESIGCKECKYLTFRLRKPLMACLDQSMYISCVTKTKAYGFSYASVMGTLISKSQQVYSYLVDMQKENSLEVLSKFFSSEFTEAFEIISEQETIIEKIKNAFDKLAVLLNTKASLIKPIFLAICSKNKSLGDWIMMNRLISMDPQFIKKEQIIFLGDIISSNRDKQMDNLIKLKEFILQQINQVISGKLTLGQEQQILLSRYLKLFNNKIREYCQYLHQQKLEEPIKLEYQVEDLDNIIALMSQCEADNTKFFNSLTGFGLIFLSPPQPIVNKTIQVNDYVNKLLQSDKNQIQNLLFSSILATTHVEVIENIINMDKPTWVLKNLKECENYDGAQPFQYAQILFNCSKQKVFRDKYRQLLTFELYQLLKQDESGEKILKSGIPAETIDLIVQTIRDIVLGGDDESEKISTLLKEDMIKSSEKGDVEFINKVIVPILRAEEKIPITISITDSSKKDKKLEPIFAGSENQGQQDNFFLKTDILNKKQKDTFSRMFKEIAADKVDNFQKLQESKWELIFEDKAHQNQNPAKFKKFVSSVSNKANVIIFVGCKVQEQQVVFGGFTNKNFPALGESWAHEFDYQVPFSEANFVCHYTPEKETHFTMTHNKPFGYIYTDYEEGGALSVSGDFFLISWSYEFQNSCGNIYDMKCIEEPSMMSFYNNMEIQHIEVWWCNIGTRATMSEGKMKSELKKNHNYKPFSPFNFFRENLVFEVSKNMTLQHLARDIMGKNQTFIKYPAEDGTYDSANVTIEDLYNQRMPGESIIDLVIAKEAQPEEEKKDGQKPQQEVKEPDIPPLIHDQPILKRFEEKGGIFDLIKAAKAAVKHYKSEKLREMWTLWLNEIESFSQLPTFFQTFCQDREKETIIYNLLEGSYDIKDNDQTSAENLRIVTQQEELHIEMVKYSYKIVNQVFEKHEGAELRDMCLKNGTFERFIERIGQLSSEKKRVKIAPSVSQSETSSPEKVRDEQMKIKKKKKEDKAKQDKTKRKGVGYTTGVGTAWNVSEYLKSKEAKSSQAANIVNILKHMIKSKDWEAPAEIKNIILESALLPTLESALRSGSLLEMAKEYELNMAYLGFVQELANHPNLIDLLLDIGEEYEPRQKEPIFQLLHKLGDLSDIFLKCLETDNKNNTQIEEDQIKPKNLAEAIQSTNKTVQEKIKQQNQAKQQQSLQEILSMPLSEAYHKLLSSLRFEYMNMKSSGIYNHAYVGELSKGVNPPMSKLVRLAQEIADLSSSLPCDYTNAIFCRVDKERVDVMKCLIMGAAGTPYAHGAFVYDLFFENSYPNTPPKCQLVTTGGQTVRFNPNLYNNGKVCLSLLGTWRGQSTENWDPKLSTILQVLLSIQAIIMSSEVYFNEPGYEHEQGTPDGERKNEGYSNIVRYCNVKFAMIDAIKNPPAGFEKVIRRSFYLKKNEVLREVKEWVDRAKTTDALYQGLVYDHNYQWAPQLSQEGKYAEMMEQIYKELKETLEGLPSPFEDETTGLKIERQFSKQDDEEDNKMESGTIAKIEDIDMSYEPISNQMEQNINIEDEKVKDRWSRYIGAMGIEAVAKQAESRIIISGLGPLGIEIAKNIVLAGCKELILYDDIQPMKDELSGQFFISENDISQCDYTKTRATFSKDKLQQLNFYVKVTALQDQRLADYINLQSDLKVIVLTDLLQFNGDEFGEIYNICRKKKIAIITAYQNGLFSRIFNDFGEEFVVVDKDGEECQEVMIQDISYNEEKNASIVTLLPGFKHKFEDGETIMFKEVLGMQNTTDEKKSINDIVVTIKVINPSSFIINEDVRNYTNYVGNGIARQVKVPKKINFKTLSECDLYELTNEPLFDQNLYISDFEKLDNKRFMHLIYKAFQKILIQSEIFDEEGLKLAETLFNFVKKIAPKDLNEKQLKKLEHLTYMFAFTYRVNFPPMAAFIGGMVAQEIVKAITQKFMPINQFFYFDCAELYQEEDVTTLDEEDKKVLVSTIDDTDRYYGIKQCIGDDLFDSIQDCKLFMIGAGAIGCELLKNYAMLGLGTGKKGQIILTDPDVIEVSNLNRQFLFREKHLRKPKSQTAAAAAIQMNPHLKNHISARLDKIHDGTAHIYNEAFFKSQTIVTNALDNIQARLYIDSKCVAARVPLIDSGTLGPKGHVQMIIPFKTESYASQNDPEDNTEIPHCTLKMFPEETLHCVEWAKDLFGNLFTLMPQSFNKLIIEESDKEINFFDQQELTALKKVIKTLEKQPKTFDDCLKIARQRFQKHFSNDIKQLLHVYPLDKTTKEGRPFWSLPKRPPQNIEFDENNLLHASVISSIACLFANAFGIKIPYDQPRSKDSKFAMAQKANFYKMPEFIPNDQKASQIQSQVEKEQQKNTEEGKEEEQVQQQPQSENEMESLKIKYKQLVEPLRQEKSMKLKVEEFEKDNDENFHIDFIYAMANVRASNYRLDEMEWINVKIKAGRIVPALATTTAAIAGLQTIELIKYLKGCKLEEHRNSFLNLAVPSLMMSEPGAAIKTKLKDDLEVTLWDRWEYEANDKNVTLQEVIEYLEKKYQLKSNDVFYGSIPLFMNALQGRDQTQKQQIMSQPLVELTHLQGKETLEFIDLTITFVDESAKNDEIGSSEGKMLQGVPPIRVTFKK